MTGGLLIVDTAFVPPGSSFGRRAGALAAETSCATAGKLSGCRGFSGGCGGRRAGAAPGVEGGGQVPGPAAGPHWARTRSDGDARLRVCNARAPRPVCVSPRSPSFPPLL